MNAEQLLAHYERVAEAPDAIARLRRLVLDLSVRGKLVPQDPKDESASTFLKRHAPSAQQDRASKKSAGGSEMLQALPIRACPAGWAHVALGTVVVRHLGGGTPSKSNRAYWNGSVRWASVKDVGKSKYLDDTIDRITEDGLANSSSNLIPPGNLLVVTRMGLGKVSINRVPVAINQDLRALFLSPVVNQDYCYNFFLTHGFEGTGLTVKGIKVEELLSIEFPLPPIAEQHRIVAKVDELMALCDRLEAARAQREATRDRLTASTLARLNTPESPASPDGDASKESSFQSNARFTLDVLPALTNRPNQIGLLRQTILNLAVIGKIALQNASEGSGRALLERLADGRAMAAKDAGRRLKKTRPAEMKSGLPELPASWVVEQLGNLVHPVFTISYGVLVPGPDVEDGVPFVRAQDLALSGHSNRPGKTIAPDVEAPYARTRLLGGEILLCVVGSIGKLGIAPKSWAGANIARAVARICPFNGLDRDFLLVVLQSDLMQEKFRDATRTVAQPTLNISLLESLPIPLPPLAEQHRIVAKVNELMNLCDQLEASLQHGENTRSRLLDALLHEALQPRNDNVIDLAAVRRRLQEKRESIACRVVQKLGPTPGFGRVRAVKPLYWAEAHCGVALGGQWGRAPVGPFDQWIYSFESHAASAGWFSVAEHRDGSGKVIKAEYRAGTGLSAKAAGAAEALGNAAAEFERVLSLLAGLNTEESEIVTTLYAAWNDLLLEGKPVSDAAVITEVREHWHPSKARFTPARLQPWLDWLRKNDLVPKGQGASTRHQAELI